MIQNNSQCNMELLNKSKHNNMNQSEVNNSKRNYKMKINSNFSNIIGIPSNSIKQSNKKSPSMNPKMDYNMRYMNNNNNPDNNDIEKTNNNSYMMIQNNNRSKRNMLNKNNRNKFLNLSQSQNQNQNFNLNMKSQLNIHPHNRSYVNNYLAVNTINQQLHLEIMQMERKINELKTKAQLVNIYNDYLLQIADNPHEEESENLLPEIPQFPSIQPQLSHRQRNSRLQKMRLFNRNRKRIMLDASKDRNDNSISKDIEIELLNNEIFYLKNLFTRRLINIEKKQLLQDESIQIESPSKINSSFEDWRNIRYAYSRKRRNKIDIENDDIY